MTAKKAEGKETPQPNLRFLFIVFFSIFSAIVNSLANANAQTNTIARMKKSQMTIKTRFNMVEYLKNILFSYSFILSD